MSKQCMIRREQEREKLRKKYADRRATYRAIIRDPNASLEEKQEAQRKMQALPRDSAKERARNRCSITGRSRGVYRKFKLCRHKIRELMNEGCLPGITKSSW